MDALVNNTTTKHSEATMTNNKQQTAVQWFLDQLIEHRIIIVDKTTYQVKYKHEILLEQAKEMEKEQIVNAVDGFPLENRGLNGDEYYEQTYGG
jgi:predicted flavoprotein YhiN